MIGQPDLYTAIANVDNAGQTPSATSLYVPRGIAVDSSGNLWVADFGNNRILRYPRPVDQQGRITADTVLGQTNFTSSSIGVASASSLNSPSAVAIGPAGEVFVTPASVDGTFVCDGTGEEARAEILKRWGRAGLVSLAYAIVGARSYPAFKYAIGHGHACQRLRVAGETIDMQRSAQYA